MSNSIIYDKFQQSKDKTLSYIKKFLQENPVASKLSAQDAQKYRLNAIKCVSEGNFSDALQNLEALKNAKCGIKTIQLDAPDIIIRDARGSVFSSLKQTEGFEMQYLNTIRAAIDIAEISGQKSIALVNQLRKKAVDFMNLCSEKDALSQKELSTLLEQKITQLGKILHSLGIQDVYKKLNIAKDFQNFNDKHSNIITISSIQNNTKLHTVIEAEVAMKSLTKSQKKQYQDISTSLAKPPSWYAKMPNWEQALCKKYANKILSGEHVIPTQLRQLAGMKNTFEKITAIYENNDLKILHTSKHAGTLASFARDKEARQDIADENARQAQEWIGSDKILHCNTFNSPILGDEKIIGDQTAKAVKNCNGRHTNTAFNKFRYIGFANNLTGAKQTLDSLHSCFSDKCEAIKPYLKKAANQVKAEKEIASLLHNNCIDSEAALVLKSAIELRSFLKKADATLRFGDAENVSLQTSTALNQLINVLSNLKSTPHGMRCLPKLEEILNMCASGKDRTGLAEHDQSAQAIAAKIVADIKIVDTELLKSGHTAQQAGGIHAGGATIGCFGTKSENKAGIPDSRKQSLKAIVEITANSNKIKEERKKTKDDLEQQEVEISTNVFASSVDLENKDDNKLKVVSSKLVGDNNKISSELVL